jgi:hypothetical protein
VQGDTGDDGLVGGGRLHGPAGALEVAADLDDPRHAHRSRQRQCLGDREGGLVTASDVEMAVVVDHGGRERIRQLGTRLSHGHQRCTAS